MSACVFQRISLIAEPLFFPFKVQLLIGPWKVGNYFCKLHWLFYLVAQKLWIILLKLDLFIPNQLLLSTEVVIMFINIVMNLPFIFLSLYFPVNKHKMIGMQKLSQPVAQWLDLTHTHTHTYMILLNLIQNHKYTHRHTCTKYQKD